MYTLGLEQEFYILDSKTYELINLTPNEIKKIFGSEIKTEGFCCQIEINTPICKNVDELETEHDRLLTHIHNQAIKHDLLILNSSTPIQKINFNTIMLTPFERNESLQELMQKTGESFICCSLQIHTKPRHVEWRYPLVNFIRPYLPILLALSTSSPFWQEESTGLKSYRTQLMQIPPRTGLPGRFENMDDFNLFVDNLKRSGDIQTAKDIWWDLGVHNTFPTLECRICDNVHQKKDAMVIAALFQALVYQIEKKLMQGNIIQETSYTVDQQNKWSAARYGLSGHFINPQDREVLTYHQAILNLLSDLEESMHELGTQDRIPDVLHILDKGTSADIQLKIYEKDSSFKSIITHLSSF
jgi:carboxylate-amine ligase